MEKMEWKWMDEAKAKWPVRGPWDQEPDKVQWPDLATGLPCLIVRSGTTGALCGYVGVHEGHPMFGVEYGSVDVDAPHCGLTFSDFCAEEQETGICHVPGPGEPDRAWWLGFDCGHYQDLSPGMRHQIADGSVYRDMAYVRARVTALAAELAAVPADWKPEPDDEA